MPLNEENEVKNYCKILNKELTKNNFRIKILSEKSLNYRIREICKNKIPYYLVIGKEEVKNKTLKLVNTYSENKITELSEEELYKKIKEDNDSKK